MSIELAPEQLVSLMAAVIYTYDDLTPEDSVTAAVRIVQLVHQEFEKDSIIHIREPK